MTTLQLEALQDAVLSVFPSSVTLNYVAYDDQLSGEEQLGLVNDLLNLDLDYDGFKDSLYDLLDSFLMDNSMSSESTYIDEIKSSMETCLQDTEHDVEDVMTDLNDFILDRLRDKDDSTPIQDLINQTCNQNIRVQMRSNSEGLDSAYHLWKDGIAYDEYFKQIVDVLNLNPSKLKAILQKANITCHGRWPNCKSRDGKEYVGYEQFAVELENTTSNCNTLTFVGKLDCGDLKNYHGKVTFAAGNYCGFFDSACGAGSIMEMKLLRPITIDFNKAQYGESCYDKFAACIDSTKSYSIDSVYGVTNKFWGERVTF